MIRIRAPGPSSDAARIKLEQDGSNEPAPARHGAALIELLLRLRASRPLTITTFAIAMVAIALPYIPLANFFSFTPLPISFLGFVAAVTVTYLVLVEIVKRVVFRTSPHVAPNNAERCVKTRAA